MDVLDNNGEHKCLVIRQIELLYLCSASAKVPCSRPWFSLMFELGSAPCVEGTCGQWGECRQYATGSLMYASCDCGAGMS